MDTQEYIQRDKEVFARLLRYISAEALARGRVIDLDMNEQLPRLIPILCEYFSREELVELVGEKLTSDLIDMNHAEVLQNLFLESELQRVLRAVNEASIPLMLFKGPALAYTVYPRPHLRTYHDLDALIRQADVERARDLLIQMGYRFYDEYRVDAVDEQRTGYNFSLQPPGFPFAVIIELHTAPHASEIGTRFDLEALWRDGSVVTILGQQIVTMNPVDHLLYLCWHYRFHGFTRLLWLYDLVTMLRAYDDVLDWTALIRTARQQRLVTTLYYCLSWCRDLFGVAVPESVFAQLHPPVVSRHIIEGIALPDVARALAVADYQEQRLIARRAMVDSNADLLKAGLRALFPSPVALKKRYMEHSHLPLQFFFLFYVVHPCITLAKGCRSLFKGQKRTKNRKERS